jgi:hypothetical protein
VADNKDKRCPNCTGEIDFFDTCKKCGREWSETLEEGEQAQGLPEGEQHPATEVKKVGSRQSRKTRFTKTKEALDGQEFATLSPEIAPKFLPWMIDVDRDGDDEIVRKRSLMRLDSRKIYNSMGLAVRAHDAQKAALLWLTRLWEFLGEDEKRVLEPTFERMKAGFSELRLVAQQKISDAAKMEVAMEKAHKQARQARVRLMDEDRKKAAVKAFKPHEDTEGFGNPEPAEIDPKALDTMSREELLELAKTRLANLDQEKALKKRKSFIPDENPTE